MEKRRILKFTVVGLCIAVGLEIGVVSYLFIGGGGNYRRNLDLGNKYLLEMDYDGAIKAFSKAIDIDGMNADAYIGRGDAYIALGDYQNAWADYEKAEELSGNTGILDEKIGTTEIQVVSSEGSIANASVELSGDTHSYHFTTDSGGYLSETLYPEVYHVTVSKDRYVPAETSISAGSGGIKAEAIRLEPETIPFSYDVLNDFMSGGYTAYVAYGPIGYALIDIDKNGIPELVLSYNDPEMDDIYNVGYEVFCYDETDGLITSAGTLTATNRNYGVYYAEEYPGLFTYFRTSGSHIDYVYEFDGLHMNWIFNSSWQRTGVSPYIYEVLYEDAGGVVSKGEYPAEERAAVYEEIAPRWTFELTMYPFEPGGQYHLTEQDIQG